MIALLQLNWRSYEIVTKNETPSVSRISSVKQFNHQALKTLTSVYVLLCPSLGDVFILRELQRWNESLQPDLCSSCFPTYTLD